LESDVVRCRGLESDNQRQIYSCYYPNGSGHCTGIANIAPVGTAAQGAARWGQLELAGNVEEWTLDYYRVPYEPGPCVDCVLLAAASSRTLRGGNFSENASVLLPPYRDASPPSGHSNYYGLRCARTAS